MNLHLHQLFYPAKNNLFPYIDGLRALSILWVISFHTLRKFGQYIDAQAYITFTTRIELNPFFQGHLAVDVFFVISGFLIAYYLFTEYKNYQTLSIKKFYLRRALRLLPAYFFTMFLFAIVYPTNLNWIWTNIFYVNNFLPIDNQFMPIAWSLAIEEQFYILFPCLILLLGTNKRLFLILTFLFILSFAICFVISFSYQIKLPLPVHEVLDKKQHNQYYDALYDKSYTRYGGLLVGVIAAYLTMFTNAISFLKQHIYFRSLLWLICLVLLVFYIFIPTANMEASVLKTAFLLAGFRNIFSLAIGYLLLHALCLDKKNWLINFLSQRFWYPIAQLSYSAYLLHPLVVALIAHYLYSSIHLDCYSLLLLIVLTIFSTLFFALIMYLKIEIPMLAFRNQLFPALKH
jgi:peptidoglycan/LPS O-acetylase OafA/YrhL